MTTSPDGMLFEPKTARDHTYMASKLNAQREVAREVVAIGIIVPAIVKQILKEMLERNFGFRWSTPFPDFSETGEFYSERRSSPGATATARAPQRPEQRTPDRGTRTGETGVAPFGTAQREAGSGRRNRLRRSTPLSSCGFDDRVGPS